MTIEQLETLEHAATTGPWEAEHRPNYRPEDVQAFVSNDQGFSLFDTLNRDHRVSGLEQLDGGGKIFDTAGMKDLALSAALRNHAPQLLAVARAAEDVCSRFPSVSGDGPGQTAIDRMRAALRALEEVK